VPKQEHSKFGNSLEKTARGLETAHPARKLGKLDTRIDRRTVSLSFSPLLDVADVLA
jgi:hypothetical protein